MVWLLICWLVWMLVWWLIGQSYISKFSIRKSLVSIQKSRRWRLRISRLRIHRMIIYRVGYASYVITVDLGVDDRQLDDFD